MDYNKIERDAIARIGAKQHKNSGRGMVKADASNEHFVIDVKYAEKSFNLNERVWSKICTDAYSVDPYKDPMLYVILGGTTRLAIVPYDALEALYARIGEESA